MSTVHIAWAVFIISLIYIFFAALKHFSRRSGMPYESWLLLISMIAGMMIAYIYPQAHQIELPANLLLYTLIPLLIFNSGRKVSAVRLEASMLPILFLVTVGVALQMLIVGFILNKIFGFSWYDGLLLGVLISATDPVAIFTILNQFNISPKLKILIEGESIFNDASVLVIYAVLISLFHGETLYPTMHLMKFAWALTGAIPLGLFLGWLCGKLLNSWKEKEFVEVNVSIALALLSFVIAEHFFHLSGVITCLFSAIALTKTETTNSPAESARFDEIWNFTSTMVDSVLFMLLGLSLGFYPFPKGTNYMLPILLVLLAARPIMIYLTAPIMRHLKQPLTVFQQNILALGGLRGAVSAIMVLLLPENFEKRDLFISLVFSVIFISVVSFPPLLRKYLQHNKV